MYTNNHSRHHFRKYFIFRKINPVIRFLTLSDFVMLSSFGLVTPIFAIFIEQNIEGGDIRVVGIAMMIFLIVKSLGQIPIAAIVDRIKGEIDDFWFMFTASIIYSIVPLLYLTAHTPEHLYLIQGIYGFAAAMALPAWMSTFTRHVDAKHQGLEWGLYYTMTDLGTAATAALGGFLVTMIGFHAVFLVISILTFIGAMFLLGVRKSLMNQQKRYSPA